jgi:hypothetical protein
MIPTWILGLGIAVLVLGAAYGVRNQINGMLGLGSSAGLDSKGGKPTIWWYVDDSQVNSRQWLDWEARTTREPNEPYLKVCQAKAQRLWDSHFTIEPIIGRLVAIKQLEKAGVQLPEGADRSPPALWMPWCRAAFLKTFGGLWLDGSVLPMGTGRALYDRVAAADVLTFGSDPDEGLSAAEQTLPAAGRCGGWAAAPGHPMWTGLERDIRALIEEGDQSWSAPEARRALRGLWDKHCSGVTRVDRRGEVSRDSYGRRLELDTLLGETDWPNGSLEGALWVPFPDGRDGLERASPWAWFLRMSEEQIHAANFVWARWARTA